MIVTTIVCAVILLTVLWGIAISNGLIAKRNRVRQCRSGICVVVNQRNDLIPNLVATAKRYMSHERETLEQITQLRGNGEKMSESDRINRGTEISSLLGRLNVAVEAYPELKSNIQFRDLQSKISELEENLQAIRRTYNAAVTDYNNSIEMFPSSIVASWRHHTPEPLIEVPQNQQQPVDVARLLE